MTERNPSIHKRGHPICKWGCPIKYVLIGIDVQNRNQTWRVNLDIFFPLVWKKNEFWTQKSENMKTSAEEKLCRHLDWLHKVRFVGLGSNDFWSCVCWCVWVCVSVCTCPGRLLLLLRQFCWDKSASSLACHLQKAERTRTSEVNVIWWEERREREVCELLSKAQWNARHNS